MTASELKNAQLRHDLRSLVEPLEIVAKLMNTGKADQALKIQEAAVELLKKTIKSLEAAATKVNEGERA